MAAVTHPFPAELKSLYVGRILYKEVDGKRVRGETHHYKDFFQDGPSSFKKSYWVQWEDGERAALPLADVQHLCKEEYVTSSWMPTGILEWQKAGWDLKRVDKEHVRCVLAFQKTISNCCGAREGALEGASIAAGLCGKACELPQPPGELAQGSPQENAQETALPECRKEITVWEARTAQAGSSPRAAAAAREAGGAGAELAADKAPGLSEAIPEWPTESVGASAPYTQRTFSRGCKYPEKHCMALGDMPAKEWAAKEARGELPAGEYLVTEILDERWSTEGECREFIVKWQGFELHPSQWIPLEGLSDCMALDVWERMHPPACPPRKRPRKRRGDPPKTTDAKRKHTKRTKPERLRRSC